ncbi:PIN domain-containing protein [Allokutzneria sp. A3M-2-11 16]|uniref:type II toxin-antitoxin system VapC family toxin n=1 Tax=Allokutzneria sp. A3M-2-11 16 TaxID=2962043 RepID=UPI0020B79904|nr:PIN domain-containing protein [Allokutzneria sp. A3M-2-11 16]MCP3801748.1 PIN domain-containing protein [Allokutzneria sp. A3M-2-11 16]
MIVLDACALIAYLDRDDAHHQRTLDLLLDVQHELTTSALTLAEALVGPIRFGKETEARKALDSLGVRGLDIPAEAARQLAALRAATGLSREDCCVLWAAEANDAQLATYDDRLARVAGERGLTVVV